MDFVADFWRSIWCLLTERKCSNSGQWLKPGRISKAIGVAIKQIACSTSSCWLLTCSVHSFTRDRIGSNGQFYTKTASFLIIQTKRIFILIKWQLQANKDVIVRASRLRSSSQFPFWFTFTSEIWDNFVRSTFFIFTISAPNKHGLPAMPLDILT